VFCARAVKAVQRASASTASSEFTARKLPDDSFVFENRIFILLPLEEIFAQKKRAHPHTSQLPRTRILFHPIKNRKKPNP